MFHFSAQTQLQPKSRLAFSILPVRPYVNTGARIRSLDQAMGDLQLYCPLLSPIILGIQAIRRAKVMRAPVRPPVQVRSQPASAPAAGPSRSSESAATTLFNQGQEFQWQGRYGDAIARYQQATRLEPNNGEIYRQMAICYIHMGWKDEAKACLDKAAQLDPKIAAEIKKN